MMPEIRCHPLGAVEDSRLLYAIIASRYQNKWLFVRNKSRDTWEMPAGHHEKDESIDKAAARELYEETGAVEYEITPVCIYSVNDGQTEAYGQLFYAQISKMGDLPDFEIGETGLFKTIPDKLTYPLIQPYLFSRAKEFFRGLCG